MTETADRLYERVLVLRCQAGDEAALVELVEHFGPRLRYFLRKMVGNTDAEDALQEVWVDVLRGIGRLEDTAAFPAWVYRIARNRAMRIRQARNPRYLPMDEADPVQVTDREEPFSAEDAAQVHSALNTLPAQHCEVLLLRFMEGMTYEQIAAVTESQPGTVRSRLHYAKLALRCAINRMNEHG
jgi:RNA polymerase sigma-70 factor, ECF subfamily